MISKLDEVPERWYTVAIRGGEKFDINEQTAEAIIKAEKFMVLRDNQGRLVRFINKVDIADIYWNKSVTKEKFMLTEAGKKLLTGNANTT